VQSVIAELARECFRRTGEVPIYPESGIHRWIDEVGSAEVLRVRLLDQTQPADLLVLNQAFVQVKSAMAAGQSLGSFPRPSEDLVLARTVLRTCGLRPRHIASQDQPAD
jgi:hypothetical protein